MLQSCSLQTIASFGPVNIAAFVVLVSVPSCHVMHSHAGVGFLGGEKKLLRVSCSTLAETAFL